MAGFFQQAGGFLFGTEDDPGLFGTGRQRFNVRDVPANVGQVPGVEGVRAQVAAGLTGLDGRTAPAMPSSAGMANMGREQQVAILGDVLGASRGEGPSVAENTLGRAMDRNLAGGIAMANTMRPGAGAAAGLRQLGAQRAQIGQETSQQVADLRANEIATARGQAIQAVAGLRAGDTGAAQLEQDAAARNLDAGLRLQEQVDRQRLALLGLDLSAGTAQQQGALSGAQLGINRDLGVAGLEAQAYEAAAARRRQSVKDALAGTGRVAGALATGGASEAAGGAAGAMGGAGGFATAPTLIR